MYISTLRSYISAMGGSLQIRAVFPEGEVVINQFQDLDSAKLVPLEPGPMIPDMPEPAIP